MLTKYLEDTEPFEVSVCGLHCMIQSSRQTFILYTELTVCFLEGMQDVFSVRCELNLCT